MRIFILYLSSLKPTILVMEPTTCWAVGLLVAFIFQQEEYRVVKEGLLMHDVCGGGGVGLAPAETTLNMTVCGC